MIFQEKSNLMLQYEKVKSKLFELEVSKDNYPKLTLNSDDLIYTTIYVLSRYCEELIENNNSEKTYKLF